MPNYKQTNLNKIGKRLYKIRKSLYSSKMSRPLRSSASSYSESVVSVLHISFSVVKSYLLSLVTGSMSICTM